MEVLLQIKVYLGYSTSRENEYKNFTDLIVNIPSNFTIKSAYLTIISQPIKWWMYDEPGHVYTRYWGRPYKLRLYKDNNSAVEIQLDTDMSTGTYTSLTQQTLSGGLFTNNSNEWTPSTPNDNYHPIEKIVSKDIKSLIGSGTTNFVIAPANEPTSALSDKYGGIGQGIAIINVYGFTQP